jgi:Tannase and feruloyl esterase
MTRYRLVKRLLPLVCIIAVGWSPGDPAPVSTASAAAASDPCAAMVNLSLPGTAITSAVTVNSAVVTLDPGGGHLQLPKYCDVRGTTTPSVGFDVRMPTHWNGKLYFEGNMGFAGKVRGDTSLGLSRNYATLSTDTGHQDLDLADASWALDNPTAEAEFGYLSVHQTALVGKQILAA